MDIIKIYQNSPNPKEIQQVVARLRRGEIVIIPTDSIYALACDMNSKSAVETIMKIKKKNLKKNELSIICSDIKQMSLFAQIDDATFKLMRRTLPSAVTFLLQGNNKLPKIFKKKRTIAVRMPDNEVTLSIVREMGSPLMVSSLFTDEQQPENMSDPELIAEIYQNSVDCIVDGGIGGTQHSTIVDCTTPNFEIVREGKQSDLLSF